MRSAPAAGPTPVFTSPARGVNFLIDCGASSLPALKRQGIACDDIDLILITHFHGDHFGGLPFLLLDAQFTAPNPAAGDRGAAKGLRCGWRR